MALSESLGDADNSPDDRIVTLYRRWAQGGYGLLITGNIMVDRAHLGEPGRSASADDVTVVLMFGTPSGVVLSPQDPSLLGRAATDLPIREGYVLCGLDPAFIAPTSRLPKLRGTVVAIALAERATGEMHAVDHAKGAVSAGPGR